MLHSNSEHRLQQKLYIFQAIASQMLCDTAEVRSIIEAMIDYELLETDWDYFWSNRVISNMQRMQEIKEKRKIAGAKWGIARMEKVAFAKQKVAKEKKIKETGTSTNTKVLDTLLSYWNEKKIIVHEEGNIKINDAIKLSLKSFTEEQIKRWIDTYATVLHWEEYLWTYKWWISEFLSRKNWLLVFMDKKPEDFPKKQWQFKKPEKKSLTQIFNDNPSFF